MRIVALWLVLCGVACGQVAFDGVDDYVGIFNGSSFANNTYGKSAVTFSMHCTVDDYTDSRSAAFYANNDDSYAAAVVYLTFNSTNEIWVGGRSASQTVDSFQKCIVNDAYKLGEEFHLCGILDYENDEISIFVDGSLAGISNVVFSSNVQSQVTTVSEDAIGANMRTTNYVVNGSITDARIYTRALSATEIAELYARPWSLADDPDLVLRTCITTNDTGDALTGVAQNYGTGADGTYGNAPTAAPSQIQTRKPRRATINID